MDKSWRDKEYLSARDIRTILSISQNTAYNIIHELPHVRCGNTYRVPTAAFEKWIRDQERSNARA